MIAFNFTLISLLDICYRPPTASFPWAFRLFWKPLPNPSLPSSSYSSPFSWPRVTPRPHFCLDSRRWHLPPVCLSFPPPYSPLSPSLWVVFPTLHLTFSCLQQTFIALYLRSTTGMCSVFANVPFMSWKKKILTCQVALKGPKFPSCTHVDTILLDLRIIPQNMNAYFVELVVGKRSRFQNPNVKRLQSKHFLKTLPNVPG